jgi:hypothetical protein
MIKVKLIDPAAALSDDVRTRGGIPAHAPDLGEYQEGRLMIPLRAIVIFLLIVLLLGALPLWPYSLQWNYYPSGILGVLIIVLLVATLLRLH